MGISFTFYLLFFAFTPFFPFFDITIYYDMINFIFGIIAFKDLQEGDEENFEVILFHPSSPVHETQGDLNH